LVSGIGCRAGINETTEQIDAMEVSGINPFKYLVVTRIAAATVMASHLVILADIISLYGALCRCELKRRCQLSPFILEVFEKTLFSDVFPAVLKTICFGFAVGLIGCYKVITQTYGTEGVGLASNAAVVQGSPPMVLFSI